MNTTAMKSAFVAAGLARVVKDIDQIAQPSIRLYATPVDENTLGIGVSKIGGSPDLPPGTMWPLKNGQPQSFIAQIRLDEAHAHDSTGVLPQQGMLWFFYDAQQQTYGADPSDAGGWFVLFESTDLSHLQRSPMPSQLPEESRFHACAIRFAEELTLSQQPQLEIAQFDWTAEEQQRYETLLSTFPTPEDHGAIHHRLLGNPNTIQDDMRQECQLASNEVADDSDPRANEVAKGAMDWRLLLQVDSDENAGMQWGNTGMLYYWIRKADLAAQNFYTTWLVMQSE